MYRLLFLCCLTISTLTQAQPTDQQYDAWIKKLSIKLDSRRVNFDAVAAEIKIMDSSTVCTTVEHLMALSESENTRCQIRAKFLPIALYCSRLSPKERLHEALQLAYEIEDDVLQYDLHLSLGQAYNVLEQYGLASMHFHLYFDILAHANRADLILPAGAFYDMSYSLYHTQEYAECIKVGLNAMAALPGAPYQPETKLTTYQEMIQWNTIGLAYHKTLQYDSAFVAFDKAKQLANVNGQSFWVGIIKGNIGDVYFDLGRYDSAYVLLQYDYDQSIAAKQYDNAANSLQWVARIDLIEGRTQEALRKLNTARRLLVDMRQPNYLANVYYAYSQLYTTMGQADSVSIYLKHYLHLHDSLQAEVTKSRTDMLQIRLNNVNQVQMITSLNRQKDQIATTRNFTIVIVLLLGIVGYLWTMRLRLRMQIRHREALEGKRIAEAETQKAIEQLNVFRQHLLEKNDLIEKWQTEHETKEHSDDQLKRLSDLTNHLILKEEDWLEFKALFDSVYPGFFISLRRIVPDISQAEQRMAALSKLKLTAKEAANLLGVSPNTIYTTRRRLRQRLGLEHDSDLDGYFTAND